MSREYFTVLGTLSSSPRGLELMRQYKIFSYLEEMQASPNLSFLTLNSLDYSTGDPARLLLCKSLISPSKGVRYFATKHLRQLFRSRISSFASWGMSYLNQQLRDEDSKVVELALSVLDEACEDLECLEAFAKCRPSLGLLRGGKNGVGANLTLRLLSTDAGFEYLLAEGFVGAELERWKVEGYINYALSLEEALENAYAKEKFWREEEQQAVGVPPHLYGELAKSIRGGEFLARTGHISYFMNLLRNPSPAVPALNKRAAVWALAHVGSSAKGFIQFLRAEGIVQHIVSLAENSPSLSMRGTCFYALGMMGKSLRGCKLLESVGWESPSDSINLCVPANPESSNFFKIKSLDFKGMWTVPHDESIKDLSQGLLDECFELIGSLSNPILTDRLTAIKRLKSKHPKVFLKPDFVVGTLQLLANQSFKLNTRRLLHSMIESQAFTPRLYKEMAPQFCQ